MSYGAFDADSFPDFSSSHRSQEINTVNAIGLILLPCVPALRRYFFSKCHNRVLCFTVLTRLEANLSWFLRHVVSFWSYHATVAGPKVTDGSMEGTVIESRDESYFKCALAENSNCS